MVYVHNFPLPLPSNGPPSGYGWVERPMSASSSTTAFRTGLDQRDVFQGRHCCIICGIGSIVVQRCYIIADLSTWSNLKAHSWIPYQATAEPNHEPRNGLLMCANHHACFDSYSFFIRYLPNVHKFVFINFSGDPDFQQYHGKAIALDIDDHHAPFPSLFIIHEMRVRGFHPFEPIIPEISDDCPWQDWVLLDGVLNSTSDTLKRDSSPDDGNNIFSVQSQHQSIPKTSADDRQSSLRIALNADVINDILAATHAMPSWKACQMEGISWTGTGEENIEKYVSAIGI